MNTALLLCLCAFAGSMAFALVISGWRQRLNSALNKPSPIAEGYPMITVIVPVRDGADTLPLVLQDLHAQRYPKERLEVIVVDDHSTDRTAEIAWNMMRSWPQLRVVKNEGEGKKAAITRGAREASGELLLVTDADVRCGPERVARIATHWARTKADMLLAPVRTESDGSLLGRIQVDEQAALFVVTAASALQGSPMLASGANMAFTKSAFHTVGGYHGDRFASGDDVFLLHRMRRANKNVSYVLDNEAAVQVEAEKTFAGFWQQRLRWAGKMRGVPGGAKWIAALGLFFPYALLIITCAINWHADEGIMRCMLLLTGAWLLWLTPVFGLVSDGKKFLGQPRNHAIAFTSFIAFTVYAPLIAISSLFVRPDWKGRRI